MELSRKLPEMGADEQFRPLASDGMLVKRPLLIGDGFVLIGFKESEWEERLLNGEDAYAGQGQWVWLEAVSQENDWLTGSAYGATESKVYWVAIGPGDASGKLWTLEKRINTDKKSVGVIAKMSRSIMYIIILELLADRIISLDDLDGFSKDLWERIAFVMQDR